jgi:pyridoxine kinase
MQAETGPAVVVISSQIGRGMVGARVEVFALERLGLPVWLVPTVWLPWHPGHGLASRVIPNPRDFAAGLVDLAECAAATEVATVLTGYFVDVEQVEATVAFVERLRLITPGLRLIVDPVVGDGHALYVPEPVAIAVRDRLLPLADIATPNLFEVGWLSGRPVGTPNEVITAARSLGLPTVVVTSAPALMNRSIATLLVGSDTAVQYEHPRVDPAPHGTGDLFASLMAARLTRGTGLEEAVNRAVESVFEVVARSVAAGSEELILAGAQDALVRSLSSVSVRRIGEATSQRRRPPARPIALD